MTKGKARRPVRPRSPQVSPLSAAKFQQALGLHERGQLDAAEMLYREVLRARPRHFDALLFLGHLYLHSGRAEQAVEATRKAIDENGRHPVAHFNLGLALMNLGRHEEAIAGFDAAAILMPDYGEAYCNRGLAMQNLGRHEEAIASFDRAIERMRQNASPYNNRGISLQQLGRHGEAAASFDEALALDPANGAAFNNHGISLMALRRYGDALASFDRALELRSDYAEAYNNRGLALQYVGRHEEAIESFDRALELGHGSSDMAHGNRAMSLLRVGRDDEAIAGLDRALGAAPDAAAIFGNRALALQNVGRFEDALHYFDRALSAGSGDAATRLSASLCRLLLGDFARGWEEFEWRWRTERYRGERREFAQPLWLGKEAVAGETVLLHAEQGLGDTLQFCRYANRVAAKGATVLLEVQPPLKAALAGLEGVSRIFAQGEPLPAFDRHCPLMSLPLAFNTDATNIPAETRYLTCDTERAAAWQAKLGTSPQPRIGVVWSGNPDFANDRHRSIPLEIFVRLVSRRAQFVSLQREVRPEDRAVLEAHGGIVHFGDALRDFSDTAALVQNMDWVVSVDTAVAHLAGALGKPVWILLPFNSDWRWLSNRSDSPWYPSARLIRQSRLDGWGETIDRLAGELKDRFAGGQNQIG